MRYYYRYYKDEQGTKFHCVYERLTQGDSDGICVFEATRKVDCDRYLQQLERFQSWN